MSAGIPRSFMCDFINLYKALPCLWNTKARDYNYRSSKAVAYNILVEKYREVEPGASKETVQQRLSSLRNCRRKEYKKVKAAQELGEVYTPQLWYYNHMSFIDEPENEEVTSKSPAIQDKLERLQPIQDDTMHTFEDNSLNYMADSPVPSHYSSDIPDHDMKSSITKPAEKRSRDEDDEDEEMLKYLKQRVKQIRTQSPTESPNPAKFEHIAFHWANKMSSLRGEQRIFAEKLINDTLYEAEFGRLGHGCRVVPFGTDPGSENT